MAMKTICIHNDSNNYGTFTNQRYDSDIHSYFTTSYDMYIYEELAYNDSELNENGYTIYGKYKLVVIKEHSNTNGPVDVYCDWIKSTVQINGVGEYAVTNDWIVVGFVPYYLGSYDFDTQIRKWNKSGQIITAEHFYWRDIPKHTFSLVYDCNGGINGPDSEEYEWNGSEYTHTLVTSINPFKKGYPFLGWSSQPNSENVEYSYWGNCEIPLNFGGTTLYAVWGEERKDQKIYIDDNKVYARSYVVEDGLQTVEIDKRGDIYASSFVQDNSFGIKGGTIYAKEFIEGEPS